ncbi:hypothetical protein B0H17DRAFT_1154322 [Mycena rosella]|uniref:Uncharacterized protein n=1 Tax=Mycena rosella TaxID=1033263 RepID=A0AAD7AZB5_MYCRO|nr:hypothetical protein B0H17DRAFT_1154322 [Mycena rosella]
MSVEVARPRTPAPERNKEKDQSRRVGIAAGAHDPQATSREKREIKIVLAEEAQRCVGAHTPHPADAPRQPPPRAAPWHTTPHPPRARIVRPGAAGHPHPRPSPVWTRQPRCVVRASAAWCARRLRGARVDCVLGIGVDAKEPGGMEVSMGGWCRRGKRREGRGGEDAGKEGQTPRRRTAGATDRAKQHETMSAAAARRDAKRGPHRKGVDARGRRGWGELSSDDVPNDQSSTLIHLPLPYPPPPFLLLLVTNEKNEKTAWNGKTRQRAA